MPYRSTIALFTSVLSLSNIMGLQRLWTMDFASRSLSMMLGSAGVLAKKFVDRVDVWSVRRLEH